MEDWIGLDFFPGVSSFQFMNFIVFSQIKLGYFTIILYLFKCQRN